MNRAIVDAIRTKRRVRFVDDGRPRVVEPQCRGVGTKGTELRRANQRSGGSPPEPLFDVAKIEDLEILDEHSDRPGPHDQRDDSAMATIFRQL